MNKLIENMDWVLFNDQKEFLINMYNKTSSSSIKVLELLDGIINMMDAIQDYAVDEMGMDERVVFDTDSI